MSARDAAVVDFDPSRPDPGDVAGELVAGGEWEPGVAHRRPDATFGAALVVPGIGGRLVLPIVDARQPRIAMTVTFWVRWGELISGASEEPSDDQPSDDTPAPLVALNLTRQRSRRTRIDVELGDERFGATVDLDTPTVPAGAALDPGGWHHLAILWDGPTRTARLLIDSAVVAEHPTLVDHLPFRRDARVVVAKPKRGVRRLRVGPLRLHRARRAVADLTAERLADLAAHPTVDESAPLAFRLSDAADEPTLSLTDDDAPGRPLHVVLENRSPFAVSLPRADAGLELRFRPGAVAGEAHHWVDPGSTRWRIESSHRPDGGTSLFLSPTEALELAPGATTAITLDHVRAAGYAGAHGTYVELCYPHPHHPELRCVRTSVARVVGRRGRRRSPLRFGMIGDAVLRHDGLTANTLRLYVANASPSRAVELRAPGDGVGTTFVLSVDAGEPDQPWALATTDQLLAAQVSTDPPDWRVEVEALDESPEWILTPIRTHVLEPGQPPIEIIVAHLFSDPGPAGRSRVTLRMENVPGYWDDERGVDVEKSRVRRDGPRADLEVGGDLRVDGALRDRYGELVPPGTIVMWHGAVADIPPGWVLCDGRAGTPDMVGRFVRGADPDGPIGGYGGSDLRSLTVEHLPEHTHVVSVVSPRSRTVIGGAEFVDARRQRVDLVTPLLTALGALRPTVSGLAVLHDILSLLHQDTERQFAALEAAATVAAYAPRETQNALVHSHPPDRAVGERIDVRPAFYELCYIMKRPVPS